LSNPTSIRRVRTVSALKETLSGDAVVILSSGSAIGDLINKLDKEYGTIHSKTTSIKESVVKRFNMLVSGRVLIPSQSIDRPPKDDDEVSLFQFAGGGQLVQAP
jgi:molybdopterin converting factor small subunit